MHALISSANISPRHKNRCEQVLRESGLTLTPDVVDALIEAARSTQRPSRVAAEEFVETVRNMQDL